LKGEHAPSPVVASTLGEALSNWWAGAFAAGYTVSSDSPLEEERFELPVPPDSDDDFRSSSPARLFPEKPTVRNPLAPPQNLSYDAA